MKGNSPAIISSQVDIHPRLSGLVKKYLETANRQELHPPTVAAFCKLESMAGRELANQPIILDSGCGTGQSTRHMAAMFPDHLVIGVDRSADRLSKTGFQEFPVQSENIIWVRAQLETFWRLATDRGWSLAQHTIFYPNPYPKPSQLQRRWHAHPVFPVLLSLAGRLELRTNWLVYAREFAASLIEICGEEIPVEEHQPVSTVSAFERKYAASGHTLYRVVISEQQMKRIRALLPGNHQLQANRSD